MEKTCQNCKYFLRHYYRHWNPIFKRYDKHIPMSEGHCRFAPDTIIAEKHPVCERFEPLPPPEESDT